jgi:hypothetical protein
MGVGKATAIATALVGGIMLAGVRSNVTSRAESTTPQATSQTVKRLGPYLHQTVRTDGMAQGFQTPEDFAATVHAARNIRMPFAELKSYIVDEGKTLPEAIHAVKPTANALLEADLARSEARADLAAIQ